MNIKDNPLISDNRHIPELCYSGGDDVQRTNVGYQISHHIYIYLQAINQLHYANLKSMHFFPEDQNVILTITIMPVKKINKDVSPVHLFEHVRVLIDKARTNVAVTVNTEFNKAILEHRAYHKRKCASE